MILWQLDTSRQQFLPHLAAAIQNIVISPRGVSYAVHLADNSVMILSTSELVPTANVAGIQARVMITHTALNAHVPRVEDVKLERLLIPRTPALINPRDPSRLLLAVGEVQEIHPQFVTALSTPFLQTFNVAYNHNISRQALSRTNTTNKIMGPSAHRVCTATVTHMQISYDGMWLVTVDDWLPPKRDVEFLGHGGMNLKDERRLRREVYLKFWQWNKSSEKWELVTRIDSPHTMAGESYGAGRVLSLAANSNSLTFSTLGEDAVVQMWRPRSRKRDGTIIRGANGESLYIWSCQRRLYIGNAEIDDTKLPGPQIPEHACLSFSEDGSVLAAAISRRNGVIHLIDPFTGTIKASRPNMYRGELISIAFLAQYLIVLSDNLQVYDLVLNERKFIVPLGDIKVKLSLDQKVEMMHLAVDRSSRTFAVSLPCKETRVVKERKSFVSLSVADTEVTVYQPEHFQPLYTNVFPSLATALLPAISSPGYIILDSAAEITTVSPKASQTLISMAKPMVDLRLDIKNEEQPAIDLLELAASAEDMENMQTDSPIDLPAATGPYTTEDDSTPMVSQHQLTSIFDVGPSFTLPPIEELFYQVAGLFSTKSTKANVL
jgi:NET1-associated nuclear protein 1 (U3 small nucleolar RNA-associated protein 17)